MAVNNGAGAVLLAAAALAGPGRRIIVSRGQLVEIGGGFRIPEVIAVSGATLVEVGTTNRTRAADYERRDSAAMPVGHRSILRVHPSNFRSVGFVEDVPIEALCGLGAPVIDDVGSGVLDANAAGIPALADEPTVARSVAAGRRARLLLGRQAPRRTAGRHPRRSRRRNRRGREPTPSPARCGSTSSRSPRSRRRSRCIATRRGRGARSRCWRCSTSASEILAARAQRLRDGIGPERCDVLDSVARVGGGALPLLEFQGPAVALLSTALAPVALMEALRAGEPPLMARVHEDRVLLDPRTLADDEIEPAIAVVRGALGG